MQHIFTKGFLHHITPALLLFMFFGYSLAHAQLPGASRIRVSGTVEDDAGNPLPGVTIKVKGTAEGTVTDGSGQFKLSLSSGQDTLVASYIGYKTKEVPVNGRLTLHIVMSGNIGDLNQVVVIGYGTQKKSTLVGSVAQVQGNELLHVGEVNTVSEALQGLMPGVVAVNTNSKPGSDAANIFIRGRSSWQDSGPLLLVDGIERNFNDIDPNEIASISVLKDASATAVYGVRGANGVILVTTKRGRLGKPVFNFSANFGMKKPTVNYEHANYITTQKMFNEAAANDQLWGQIIPSSTINSWEQNIGQAGPYNQYFPQVDWWNELIGTGYQQKYNLNVSGGTKFMRYFTSVGYLNDGDIYKIHKNARFDPSFGVKRYNWRSNFDFDLTSTTTFSVNFSGNYRYRNQPYYRIDGTGEDGYGQNQAFNSIFEAPPNLFPLKYPDGFPGESPSGDDNVTVNLNDGGQRIYKYYQGFYDAGLKQDLSFITKGLSFKARISYTTYSNHQSGIHIPGIGGNFSQINVIRYYRSYDYTHPQTDAAGNVTYPLLSEIRWPTDQTQVGPLTAFYDNIYGYGHQLNYEFSGHYKRSFGLNEISGLILMNRQSITTSGSGVDIPFPSYREDYVSRVTYSYADRYLLEINGAYTGSEKFAPGKRFGFFPSVSVGWVATEEPFFKSLNSDFLNFFKIRYSDGRVGSDNGAPRFAYIQQYTSGGAIGLGYEAPTSYGPLYHEGRAANPDQTWETSDKQDLGFDFNILNKLEGTIDLFKEHRTGILMILTDVPAWFGAGIPSGNVGSTKNRGFEIDLGWKDHIGPDFHYHIAANYSTSENRVIFRGDPRNEADYLKNAGKPIGWTARLVDAGYYTSLDDVYNYSSQNNGVTQNNIIPGDLMYLDYNADGRVDDLDKVAMKYTTYPFTTYGLNLDAGYKRLQIRLSFYGVSQVGKVLPGQIMWDFNGGFISAQSNVSQRWTAENSGTAEKPALHITNTKQDQTGSSYNYANASYVRLKSAEISYDFQSTLLKKIGLNEFQVYVNGNNLLTFTNLNKRIDPETDGTSVYPIVKRFNFGFRTSF